ncbi:MAG: hypothetical protein PSU94_10000 [Lacunisphaera sp.]|nr:hypothetical protein [Lacunisphaera sp.]
MKTSKPLKRIRLLLCATLLSGLAAHQSRADENYFGYTYGAETLPKGGSEIYQWVTVRTGKADGSYKAVDLQTEIEHGFTDHLQGSIYLNAIQHNISGVSDFTSRDQFRFNGLQGSLKYNLRSPYKDGYGLALYAEPGYKRYSGKSGDRQDTFFFETKVITQKNYLEDTLIWATNFSAELEREHNLEEREWETELELTLSTGFSYRIAPRWFIGAEAVAVSAFERADLGKLGEYALFLGPNLHYASKRWWATLTALPQLTGWPENSGAHDLEHFEKLEIRLKVGLNF